MIRFPFNEAKAAQAASFFLGQHGGRYSYIGLLKLMYLADRKALVETGMPITGDKFVSMEYGPVLSRVRDCLTGWQGAGAEWGTLVSRNEANHVRLLRQEECFSQLSDFELEVLEAVDREYGHLKPFDLVEVTHRLPEWRDPDGTSIQIDPEEILRASDFPDDKIAQVAADAEELMRLHSVGASGI